MAHSGVCFSWTWTYFDIDTFKLWIFEVPEFGVKFKNTLLCFHVKVWWQYWHPKYNRSHQDGGVGDQWERSPPLIKEFIFCRELKNNNKTRFAFYYHHIPIILMRVSDKILNNVSGKIRPLSCSLLTPSLYLGDGIWLTVYLNLILCSVAGFCSIQMTILLNSFHYLFNRI